MSSELEEKDVSLLEMVKLTKTLPDHLDSAGKLLALHPSCEKVLVHKQ